MTTRVGYIGLGNMGNPMAMNVCRHGHAMTVYDLDATKMRNLVEAGATAANSALDVLEASDVVLTCLPASPHVEGLYLGADGLVARARAGTVLVDMSSVLPATPARIEQAAKARGIGFLEAPVSGGVPGARAATLAIMTGGDAALFERLRPLLSTMGTNLYHVGPAGAGNTIKAINNMMAAVNACAMMEGLALGLKAGLSLETMHSIVTASSGNSNALARVPRALIPRNFEPGFKVQLMSKDLDTFNTIAKDLHVPVTFSNLAQHYQQAALAAGHGDKDTSIIFTIIERLSGIGPDSR